MLRETARATEVRSPRSGVSALPVPAPADPAERQVLGDPSFLSREAGILGLRDAVRIETAVRGYGGIWLAMEGNRETLDRVESLLPRSESVVPGRLRIHSLSS